ncbi:Mss4-like protein [Aspergillus karnatakaensis]|uniref:GFA family protein n=1 Tax=Aspergillus karnatakaensis TaxID=1810916 RepID=UPI003CCD237C
MPTHPPTPTPTLKGSCYCKSTTYTTTSAPYGLTFCYCTMCQKLHGAPFAPFTNVATDHFHWTRKDNLVEINLSKIATRTICGMCRAPLTMVYHHKPQETGVVAVTVDEEFKGLVPSVSGHIFVERKPGWFVIGDQARQELGVPESLRGVVPDDL